MAKDRGGAALGHVRALLRDGSAGGRGDAELLRRFLGREVDRPAAELAFEALVARHGPAVLRACRRALGDEHRAHDAFQATFLILADRAGTLWVGDSLGPWLLAVARRVARSSRKSETRRGAAERRAASRAVEAAGGPEPGRPEAAAVVRAEVDRLPERLRAVVALCDLEGLTREQAARRLGVPPGTIQSRLARARARLRERLSRRGLAPAVGLPAVASRAAFRLPEALRAATVRSAAGSGSVPAPVSDLVQGGLRTMGWFQLKLAAAACLAAGSLAIVPVGLAFGPGPGDADRPPAARPSRVVGVDAPRPEPEIAGSVVAAHPDEPDGAGVAEMVAPRPWETVVRIKIQSEGSIGFGSGTVIRSTDDETFVLTAAHHFRGEGPPRGRRASPAGRTTVELFDGRIARGEEGRAQVRATGASFPARLIAADDERDVALLRFHPGRRLPAAPVQPPGRLPPPGMTLIAVGCSEGRDATAWATEVTRTGVRGLSGRPGYEAIECRFAPLQGRSGGGLFGPDGTLWGVCNYSDPRGDRGLYAPPGAIDALLRAGGLADAGGVGRPVDEARLEVDLPNMPYSPPATDRERGATPARPAPGDPPPAPADVERRLGEVERTLERVLRALERLESRGPR